MFSTWSKHRVFSRKVGVLNTWTICLNHARRSCTSYMYVIATRHSLLSSSTSLSRWSLSCVSLWMLPATAVLIFITFTQSSLFHLLKYWSWPTTLITLRLASTSRVSRFILFVFLTTCMRLYGKNFYTALYSWLYVCLYMVNILQSFRDRIYSHVDFHCFFRNIL